MRYWLPFLTTWLIAAVVAAVLLIYADPGDKPPLSERVNGACRDGFVMADWTSTNYSGEPMPFVVVTCESLNRNDYGQPVKVYKVAVEK